MSFALVAALLASAAQAPAVEPEMRGLWVVRTALVSPQEVDRVVDDAARAGFNALFVQVRGRGDAFYDSRVVVRSALLAGQPASFDPLGRLIERARTRGLAVHGWINILLSAHFGQGLPAEHVVARYPDWLMVPRAVARTALAAPAKGLAALIQSARDVDTEGFYISPSAPGARDLLDRVVHELLRGYPLDGIHFDFIRYPGPEFDYSRHALEGFQRAQPGIGSGDLLAAVQAAPEAWSAYRRSALTALADRLVRAARAERPSATVSAAVVPDETSAMQHKFQAWPEWLASGLLDAVCPMTYTPDAKIYRAQVEQARTRVGPRQQLWPGVGAYRMKVDEVIDKIRIARSSGASGVLIFSHESLGPEDRARLRAEAFASEASGAVAPASSLK